MSKPKKQVEASRSKEGYQPSYNLDRGYQPIAGPKPPPPKGASGLQPKADQSKSPSDLDS
jgi:hypothetical protein